jgi:sporulation protein YhbH
MMKPLFLLNQDDWSLHRKGQIDQQRHQEKVKEAIKQNLADIISEESIITSDGKKTIKLPVRSLEEYRFKFNYEQQHHTGQGDGKSKAGDVLGQAAPKEAASGEGAGEEPGVDYYEAEVTVDELAELIFSDLGLPNLKDKKQDQIHWESYRFTDVRKNGIMSNVDKKRTIMQNIKSNALKGVRGAGAIQPDDLRFKTWEVHHEPYSNAVVLAMMDTSGSMDTYKKYLARSFFFWMVRFLRTKYAKVEIVFLAHHTEAKEVNEEEFFTKGESGGTRCSSVYRLALEIIGQRYPPSGYNIYPFHFSDGDNIPADNQLCLELVRQLLKFSNMVGYGEVKGSYHSSNTLWEVFSRIDQPNFVTVAISDKTKVYPALQKFFQKG